MRKVIKVSQPPATPAASHDATFGQASRLFRENGNGSSVDQLRSVASSRAVNVDVRGYHVFPVPVDCSRFSLVLPTNGIISCSPSFLFPHKRRDTAAHPFSLPASLFWPNTAFLCMITVGLAFGFFGVFMMHGPELLDWVYGLGLQAFRDTFFRPWFLMYDHGWISDTHELWIKYLSSCNK